MSAQKVEVTISNRTMLRVVAVLIATYFLFVFVRSTAHILELIFLAAFLSLAINPAITWIVKRLHLKSRVAGIGIAYLVTSAVIILFTVVVLVPLIQQTITFVSDAPQTVRELKSNSGYIGNFIRQHNLQDQVNGLSENIKLRTHNIQQPLLENAGRVGSALIAFITLFALIFMMLVEGPRWTKLYWHYHPEKYRERHRKLAARMYDIVTGYVVGQIVLALLAAMFTTVVLFISSSLLHVSVNVVALAGVVFITALIPMIGHIIGGVIVVLACSFVSIPLALIMAVFMLVERQIENVTLQPYIQAKYNELTPLAVFITALVGISFGGILGAFVAIPLVGCIKIVLMDYLEHRQNGVAH